MKVRQVAGYPKYKISESGNVYNKTTSKRLRAWLNVDGYLKVELRRPGCVKQRSVHQLVAETWIGKRPKGKVVNHIDENKTNNHWSNLEYLTNRQNTHHSIKLKSRSVLSESDVLAIKRRVSKGKTSARTEAFRYKVSESTVLRAVHGTMWKDVKGPNTRTGDLKHQQKRKLTNVQARRIRIAILTKGKSMAAQARFYTVSESSIRQVLCGKTYPSAGGPIRNYM